MRKYALSMGAALMAGIPLFLALPAQAEMPEGVYFGSSIGINSLENQTFKASTLSNKVNSKDALSAAFELGYQFGSGMRYGIELSYAAFETDEITGGPANRTGRVSGLQQSKAFMLTAQRSFDLGSPWVPYIGAGIGWAFNDLDAVGPLLIRNGLARQTDGNLSAQLTVGATYTIMDGLDLNVGYRYQRTDNLRYDGYAVPFKTDQRSHGLFIGVRTVLGQAPAKPVAAAPVALPAPAPMIATPAPAPVEKPAAPAPALVRNYTVFFDFNRSTLTTDAQQVLQSVARDVKKSVAMAISVTGHADSSGAPDYNEKLSQRRAEAVREYLVSQGVPASHVRLAAKGETDPLVPTADGVREPSNRRVVIIIP
jgi:OmpA-OmpF porin, OOP family